MYKKGWKICSITDTVTSENGDSITNIVTMEPKVSKP
jgi:hypothetical protein